MSTRTQRREMAETAALAALRAQRKPWSSARDLAKATGRPWRSVARALLRMVAAGQVQQHIIEWQDPRSRQRETRLYRAPVGFDAAVWPESLMPRVKTSLRSSAGKAKLMKENDG
jgi:hypothetical protein